MRSQRLITIGILVALCVGVLIIAQMLPPVQQSGAPAPVAADMQQYTNAAYGLSFSYPSSYVLSERTAPGSAMRAQHSIILMRKADLPPPIGGEGPPAITIDLYQNDLDAQTADGWIQNTSESNYKLGDGVISSTTISGFPARSYRWSGLYEGTTIVVAQPKWVYALSVTYLQPGDPIVQDFVLIRDGVKISQ